METAEEYYNLNPETIQDIGKGRSAHTKRMMIEFAKLHVEAALKKASENVSFKQTCKEPYKCTSCIGQICEHPIRYVHSESILKSYPLTNII